MTYRENDTGPWGDELPWTFKSLLQALALLLVMAVLLAISAQFDEMRYDETEQLAQQERHRLATPREVADAYQQGMSAAMTALDGTPRGIELAQACMASGFRRSAP